MSITNETTDINTPFSYQEYELSNLRYYLAANVSANRTFPLQYYFINSEEEVKGLFGRFITNGIYYLHIRATILGKVRPIYMLIFVAMLVSIRYTSFLQIFLSIITLGIYICLH